jgi:hypothetical protein
MKGGTPAYVREGRVYEGGIFGGDLEEAVRGNPEAESHARAFQNELIGGLLGSIGGSASMATGAALYASGRSFSDRDSTKQTVGASLFVGGLAAFITGMILLTTAQPHHWDAINIYNDGLPDASRPPPPYGPLPPYVPRGPVAPPQASPPAGPPVPPTPPAAPTPREKN